MKKSKWTVNSYKKDNGEEPVSEFLDSLPAKERAKVLRTIQLLGDFGTMLGMPHRRSIDQDVYELRTILGKKIFRVFHFHYKNGEFILLNGFRKKLKKHHRVKSIVPNAIEMIIYDKKGGIRHEFFGKLRSRKLKRSGIC